MRILLVAVHLFLMAFVAVALLEPSDESVERRDEGAECTWSVTDSRLLTIEDRLAYVEPITATALNGDVLLLGQPSYLTPADGGPTATDEIVGVVLDADGSASPVVLPEGGAWSGLAAVAGDETWQVVAASIPPDTRFPNEERTRRLVTFRVDRNGVLSEWTEIQLEEALNPFAASNAVSVGDTLLAWSARAMLENGLAEGAAFLLGRAGWHMVEVPSLLTGPMTMGRTNDGPVLVVSARLDGQAEYGSSLQAWPLDSEQLTNPRTLTMAGPEGSNFEPAFDAPQEPMALGWRVRNADESTWVVARWNSSGTLGETRVAARGVRWGQSITLRGARTSRWLIESNESGSGTLRIVAVEDDAVRTEWEHPNPFDGYVGAAALDRDTALLFGPQMQLEGPRPVLATLALTIDRRCSG